MVDFSNPHRRFRHGVTLENAWENGKRSLLDFVFPPRCALCDDPLPDAYHDSMLCVTCRRMIVTPGSHCCCFCGAEVATPLPQATRCGVCREEIFRFSRVYSLGDYKGTLRNCILEMKRQTTGAWAASLTSLFWERRSGELAAAAPDLLVAVPMHRWRRIRRGVNPAQAIAERLARLLEKPFVPGALVQCRRTKPQHWLTAAQRRRNVKNAFRVSRNNWRIRGKRVLLVDDVMTTGTTCDEIAGVLLEAGAVEVRVAVLARGTGGKKSHR